MLRIELSALSAQELRRLQESARARNQTTFVEQLEAELQARPTRAEDWAPAPMSFAHQTPLDVDEPLEPPRRNRVMAATAALAAFVSAAVTWGLSVPTTPRPEPATTAQAEPAPRAAVMLASLAPVGPPPAFSEPPPVDAAAEAPPAPIRVAAASAAARRARANPCLDLPTAAERLVCGYPSLAAQDRQLRTAYERALAAGADRRELDRDQAAWRGESEKVSDHRQLAERYDRRIRELQSAAIRPPAEEPVY
jgi:uncharacterized protein YecT (DUF1311 family)